MTKLEEAIKELEGTISIIARQHGIQPTKLIDILSLLYSHSEDDQCFADQFMQLQARIQKCPAGHEYLANSPEYPCPWCELAKREIDLEILNRALHPQILLCGHPGQYGFTEDGGKHIVCLVCIKVKYDEQEEDRLP